MPGRFPLLVALALVAGLASDPQSAHAQLDQVFLGKGTPSKGALTEMTKDTVTLDMSGIARPFQVNEITRVTFADEPSELNNARNAVAQRNYSLALQELRKLDGMPAGRREVASDIGYYKALCMARLAMSEGGDKTAAMKALREWVVANSNSHHFYEAAETLGDLAVSSGNFAEAVNFYNPISKAPWADYQLRANIAVGRALVAQKQFPDALQRFEAVIATDVSGAEAALQKQLATAGKAVCLAETGKADEGVALLNDMVAKNDPQDKVLFARTYNALGNCYLKLNRPKDALQAFLFTDILFYEDADSHAEALYRLSKLWNEVNKADRAVQARNTLRERYAGSVWAGME